VREVEESGIMNDVEGAQTPRAQTLASLGELSARDDFHETFANCPIPPEELLGNLGLFLNRQTLSRLLALHELYQRIIDVQGVVVEFGCRWGQNLAMFSSFRGMHEPFNHTRKIVGFDSFSGFPAISPLDGERLAVGGWSVTPGYEDYLDGVLAYHESESPLAHIKRYEIVKGDVTETVETYLEAHPETIIALAYFDLDLYEPTKRCLELIRDRVTKGTVIAFDEIGWASFPGETTALKEVLGFDRYALRRFPINPRPSYLIVE
jgi:hypothetical protein